MPRDDALLQMPGPNTLPSHFLNSGLDVNMLRTNTLLRKDEWELLDERLVRTFDEVLNGIMDLRTMGLTIDLGGMATVVSEYEKLSDMEPAEFNLAAGVEGTHDRAQYTLVQVPVPMIYKDFQFDIRHLSSSRRLGQSLDTTQSEICARKVAEGLESLLFNGNTTLMGGVPIFGYLTHPDRNTVVSAGDWGVPTNIYPDILAMVNALHQDRAYGPKMLYLNPIQYTEALNITDTHRLQSELQTAIASIPMLMDIKLADEVPAGQGVMVNMTRDTTELAIGEDVTNVEWETMGGMVSNFRVMLVAVPRIKSDFANRCGIAHITGI